MAPRTNEAARFRGCGSAADPFAANHEDSSDKASRAVGTIFAASLLRPPSVLLRRSHPDGQCVDAERMATIRTSERDIYGDASHSKDFLKERGQERTARTNTNVSQIRFNTGNKLEGWESQRALTCSNAI
jgi:hypothetical protein